MCIHCQRHAWFHGEGVQKHPSRGEEGEPGVGGQVFLNLESLLWKATVVFMRAWDSVQNMRKTTTQELEGGNSEELQEAGQSLGSMWLL